MSNAGRIVTRRSASAARRPCATSGLRVSLVGAPCGPRRRTALIRLALQASSQSRRPQPSRSSIGQHRGCPAHERGPPLTDPTGTSTQPSCAASRSPTPWPTPDADHHGWATPAAPTPPARRSPPPAWPPAYPRACCACTLGGVERDRHPSLRRCRGGLHRLQQPQLHRPAPRRPHSDRQGRQQRPPTTATSSVVTTPAEPRSRVRFYVIRLSRTQVLLVQEYH